MQRWRYHWKIIILSYWTDTNRYFSRRRKHAVRKQIWSLSRIGKRSLSILPPFDRFHSTYQRYHGCYSINGHDIFFQFRCFCDIVYHNHNRCILKLLWMSLTAMRSKMLSSLPKGNAAPRHQRDTEFTKLMKAASYPKMFSKYQKISRLLSLL